MTCPDCHPAYVAGLEQGRAERIKAETEDRARALLIEWSRESRDMSTEYASKVGPNWTALVLESGDRDD